MTAYIYLWKLRPLTRQGVYFAAVAISDNCSLFVIGFVWMFLAKGLPWISGARIGFFIMNQSEFACRTFRYLETFTSISSSSLFLLMVIDRCLSVYFPFRFQLVSAKTAIKACLAMLVVDASIGVVYNLPHHWVLIGEYTVCTTALPVWLSLLQSTVGLLLYFPGVIQFIGILVVNGFLIRKMRQIASEQAEIRAGRGDSKLTNTVICVALSVILMACSAPIVIFSVGNALLSATGFRADWVLQKTMWACSDIGRMLVLLNLSVNWIILLCTSAQFRRAFLSTVWINHKAAGSEYQMRARSSTDQVTNH